jgi:hypothetical protein
MRHLLSSILFICFFYRAAAADVIYTQSMRYTGGSMLEMVRKMAANPGLAGLGGGGLKNVLEDQTFVIYIKGPKMARVSGKNSTIFDLKAGTMTNVNHEKHTFTVQSFDELREQMDGARQRMSRVGSADLQFDTKVQKLGEIRTIGGKEARSILISMTAKSSGPLGQMLVKTTAWVVPADTATREVSGFWKRLSEKFAYAFSGFSLALGPAGGGLNAAMKEVMNLDGYPVLSDTDISGISPPIAALAPQGGKADGAFIQIESESSKFAAGPIEDTRFVVPADYKQEEIVRRY